MVGDAKYSDIRAPAPPTVYLHYSAIQQAPVEFSLRTVVSPGAVAEEARRILENPSNNLPVTRVTTLVEHVNATIVPERLSQ
jgi:hypothetical protein